MSSPLQPSFLEADQNKGRQSFPIMFASTLATVSIPQSHSAVLLFTRPEMDFIRPNRQESFGRYSYKGYGKIHTSVNSNFFVSRIQFQCLTNITKKMHNDDISTYSPSTIVSKLLSRIVTLTHTADCISAPACLLSDVR